MIQVAAKGLQKNKMERWVGALIGASDIRLCGALEKGSARRTILADSARSENPPLSMRGRSVKVPGPLRKQDRRFQFVNQNLGVV